MMRLIESAYTFAKAEMGVKELDGSGNNPRILEYLRSVDFNEEIMLADSIAWCSAFVNWCIQQAGGKGTRSPLARSFLTWGRQIEKPEKGCIAIIKRGREVWKGHVGFVEDSSTKYITLLGGNQHNSVCFDNFPRTSVLGYRTSKD
ncbi:MAG: TIGR02594 family protein [Bdellovibrionales bacterium]|nr:TIGR02594 family protein [Bdellovibrionales bacterium]